MRVLIADDHALFRDGITSLLEAAGFQVVGQVGDGQAAVNAAKHLCPDLVLLDIAMPRMGGLEAVRQIKEQLPRTEVVMLTVSEDEEDLIAAIKAGADGYLLKDLRAAEFLEMLAGLEHGEAAITRKTAARLIGGLAEPSHPRSKPTEPLTEREIQLLEHVAEGLSNKGIARELSISENTVKYHLKKIFQKLGAQNRTDAVTRAISTGLLSHHPPD